MNNLKESTGAATPQIDRQKEKRAVNTRVHPVINFQLGIIAVLLCAIAIMELTTPVVENNYATRVRTVTMDDASKINNFEIIPDKPKPQPKAKKPVKKQPAVQPKPVDKNKAPKIVDDKSKTVETDFTKTTDNKPVIDTKPNTKSTKTADPVIPSGPSNMLAVHEVPLFPGCNASYDNIERRDCFNNKMNRFITRKFDRGLAQELNLSGTVKIDIQFTIGEDGMPKDIAVRAPHPRLKQEAIRLINKLPQIQPGKINDLPVNVIFALPIRFQIK